MPGNRVNLRFEKLKVTFSSWPSEQYSRIGRTIAYYQRSSTDVSTNTRFTNAKNTNSLRDTRNITTHMVFEGELTLKLHAKYVELGTSSNGNPGQSQVTTDGEC